MATHTFSQVLQFRKLVADRKCNTLLPSGGKYWNQKISFFVMLTCITGIGVGFQPQPSDVSNNQDRLEKLKVIDGEKPQNNEN